MERQSPSPGAANHTRGSEPGMTVRHDPVEAPARRIAGQSRPPNVGRRSSAFPANSLLVVARVQVRRLVRPRRRTMGRLGGLMNEPRGKSPPQTKERFNHKRTPFSRHGITKRWGTEALRHESSHKQSVFGYKAPAGLAFLRPMFFFSSPMPSIVAFAPSPRGRDPLRPWL
jgi:hypothetical protein